MRLRAVEQTTGYTGSFDFPMFAKEGVRMKAVKEAVIVKTAKETVHRNVIKYVLTFVTYSLCSLFFAFSAFAETPLGRVSINGSESRAVQQCKQHYNRAYFTNLAAIACSGVYRPQDSEEMKYLAAYGWRAMHHTAEEGKQLAHFSVFYNVQNDGTPLYLIAFRGSADKKDVLTDLRTGLVPFEDQEGVDSVSPAADAAGEKDIPKVHKGFNDYTHAAMRALLSVRKRKNTDEPPQRNLLQILQQQPEAHLLLTGHSLGGAAATLMGQRLLSYGIDPQRIHVVTFGAPAIGNQAFAEKYGRRLDLLRVTNTADPVPLTLQALFGKYKQFGDLVKFKVSLRQSNLTHFMNVYLDTSQKEYYKALDRAVEEGAFTPWPAVWNKDAQRPKVAVWLKEETSFPAKSFAPNLHRFILNEYKALLPNYAQIQDGSDVRAVLRRCGADYLLIIRTGAVTNRRDNSWFLTLEQQLLDKEGRTLSAGRFAKRTSPEAGNITAAMEAVRLQKQELYEKLPWLRPRRQEPCAPAAE